MNPLLSSGFTRHQSRNFGLTGGGAVVCRHPGSCPQNTCSRPRPGPQPRSARAGPVPAARVLPARVRRLPRAAHPWRGRAAHRRRHRTRRCSAVLTPFAVPARDAGSSQALPAIRMPPAAPNGSTPPEARGRGAAVTGAPPLLASLPAPRPLFLPGRPASPRMAPTPGAGARGTRAQPGALRARAARGNGWQTPSMGFQVDVGPGPHPPGGTP